MSIDPLEDRLSDFIAKRVREARQFEAAAPKEAGQVFSRAVNRLAAAVERAEHPLAAKKKLADLIRRRVRCEGMHPVEAERAAEYVVFDGLPLETLGEVLDAVDDWDRRGKIRPFVKGEGGGRGGFFVGVLKRRLVERGIKQRKRGA